MLNPLWKVIFVHHPGRTRRDREREKWKGIERGLIHKLRRLGWAWPESAKKLFSRPPPVTRPTPHLKSHRAITHPRRAHPRDPCVCNDSDINYTRLRDAEHPKLLLIDIHEMILSFRRERNFNFSHSPKSTKHGSRESTRVEWSGVSHAGCCALYLWFNSFLHINGEILSCINSFSSSSSRVFFFLLPSFSVIALPLLLLPLGFFPSSFRVSLLGDDEEIAQTLCWTRALDGMAEEGGRGWREGRVKSLLTVKLDPWRLLFLLLKLFKYAKRV